MAHSGGPAKLVGQLEWPASGRRTSLIPTLADGRQLRRSLSLLALSRSGPSSKSSARNPGQRSLARRLSREIADTFRRQLALGVEGAQSMRASNPALSGCWPANEEPPASLLGRKRELCESSSAKSDQQADGSASSTTTISSASIPRVECKKKTSQTNKKTTATATNKTTTQTNLAKFNKNQLAKDEAKSCGAMRLARPTASGAQVNKQRFWPLR